MPKRKPTWTEKLQDSKDLPKVKSISGEMCKKWGSGTLVIPAPLEVDGLMQKVPNGKLTTVNEIRAALARKHQATVGCPMTTGIFSWVAAHAAEEQRTKGKSDVTPYWRTLKTGGRLNEKYPGGIAAQKAHLEAEGHVIIKKGDKYYVQNYERALVLF